MKLVKTLRASANISTYTVILGMPRCIACDSHYGTVRTNISRRPTSGGSFGRSLLARPGHSAALPLRDLAPQGGFTVEEDFLKCNL